MSYRDSGRDMSELKKAAWFYGLAIKLGRHTERIDTPQGSVHRLIYAEDQNWETPFD